MMGKHQIKSRITNLIYKLNLRNLLYVIPLGTAYFVVNVKLSK